MDELCNGDRGGKYKRTRASLMRAAKTAAESRYNLGGRPKKAPRPVPSLPKLKCLEDGDGSSPQPDAVPRDGKTDQQT